MEQWSEQDAKLILTNSPWVKKVTPALMPQLNEDQRRQGGQMGGGDGIGMEAFTPATLTGVGASVDSRKAQAHPRGDSRNPLGKRSGRARRGRKSS